MPPALDPASLQETTPIYRDRSPHPYARKGSLVRRNERENLLPAAHQTEDGVHTATGYDTPMTTQTHVAADDASHMRSVAASVSASALASATASHAASSDSGTEADDELGKGPQFLKALPPPATRPRKGLIGEAGSDGHVSPLLTPAQLDRDDRTISQGYFHSAREGKGAREKDQSSKEEEALAARELFMKRKRAERIRRIAESALLAAIGLVVLCGHAVWTESRNWHREIISQISTVLFIIAIYPLRVVTREELYRTLAANKVNIFRRFRVPASFDPASILYPTFVPVLVALSLLPQYPALLLPNLILGLASLPPRLFPEISRFAPINTLGWMTAIVPLIASENTALPPQRFLPLPYSLKAQGPPFLHPELLVLLYPLHQALLAPLNYLTTTSLLPVEKHMLAAGLVNLLCFAISPQACILRALLWVGGVWVLVTCTSVLQWNVTLARVPRWKFRRTFAQKGSAFEEFTSTLRELISTSPTTKQDHSDADEDDHEVSRRDSKFSPPRAIQNSSLSRAGTTGPESDLMATSVDTLTYIANVTASASKRRHTMPTVGDHTSQSKTRPGHIDSGRKRRGRAWYLELTLEGANLRTWLYSCWVYAVIIGIILVPVRMAIAHHALNGAEPVLWALDYIFGDMTWFYSSEYTLKEAIATWVDDVRHVVGVQLYETGLSMPSLRLATGPANTRILVAVYWVVVVALGIATVTIMAPRIEVDTRRKIFHATIVTMLLPTTFVDPCFCGLALGLVLAIFLLLEVIRAGQIPPLGAAIGRFVAPYVDGRDLRGPMVVSHVFLLIGCAIPLWLSLAGSDRDVEGRWLGWELRPDTRDVAMVAGVVCVGMGDAAASLMGRRYGRRKWPWLGGKSLEGSTAFSIAVMIGLMTAKIWLHIGGWTEQQAKIRAEDTPFATYWILQAGKALLCGCGASLMEAVLTGANDNVVVPIALWLLVRGVRY
ncbi:hypothetical protein AAFC00_002666 [Neodothiora populina]|uniref:dolichol kinase n=1 Tax=Neodothiora populina TaxID=2781224 RepID=A0ABR3P8I9_9PEZI